MNRTVHSQHAVGTAPRRGLLRALLGALLVMPVLIAIGGVARVLGYRPRLGLFLATFSATLLVSWSLAVVIVRSLLEESVWLSCMAAISMCSISARIGSVT